MSELVLYTSDDGITRMNLRVEGETIWLTQLEIAELFQTTKQNVSLHAKNIIEDAELVPEATVKDSLTVQTEGKREVERKIQLCNLDLILAIGYRVRSPRGVQLRHNPSKAPTGRHHTSPGHRPGSIAPIESGALKGRNMGGAA